MVEGFRDLPTPLVLAMSVVMLIRVLLLSIECDRDINAAKNILNLGLDRSVPAL